MAYTIESTSYMCRTEKPVRLYNNPNDIRPGRIIIPAGSDIITDGKIDIGTVTFLRIVTIDGVEDGVKGSWITTDSLQLIEIEDEVKPEEKQDSNDSKPCDECLLVNGSEVVIYDTYDSTTPITGLLDIGDSINTDRIIEVNSNGVRQTRYRISDVTCKDGSKKSDLIGNWVLANFSIKIDDKDVFFSSRVLKMSKAGAYYDVAPAAETSGNTVNTNPSFMNPTNNPTLNDLMNNIPYVAGASIAGSTLKFYQNQNAATMESVSSAPQSQTEAVKETVSRVPSYDYQAESQARNEDEFNKNYSKRYQAEESDYRDDEYNLYISNYTVNTTMSTPIGRLLFVHGMPFQYTHLADRRAYSDKPYGASNYPANSNIRSASKSGGDFYGRTFAKEIAANMPIVTVVPGVPKFLTMVRDGLFGGSSKSNRNIRESWIPFFTDLTDTEAAGALDSLNASADSSDVYQYYSMKIETTGYYNYVNSLCQTSAILMGIGDELYYGKRLSKFDWGKYNTAADQDYSMLESVMGSDLGVSFAFDPMSSITDSLSNSTGESQFAGMLNGISSKARELDFMTGNVGVNIGMIDQTDYSTATAQLNDGIFRGVTNPLSHISTFIQNAGHGMNVRFPQIWNDSNSTKSYSIDMKFIAPYATQFCKWRYVLVPFFHWFALAAPHSDDSLVNYSRPFLIRAFSKGYFNIEMGIVNSIQWRRFGDGDMISADGIPTEIDVTVEFEDLYQQLAVSQFGGDNTISTKRAGIFFNNTGLMDLVGTLSGVNMNKIDIGQRWELFTSAWENSALRTGTNFMRNISDRLTNIYTSYLMGV